MAKDNSKSAAQGDASVGTIFQFFNEIAIINQLASTLFQNRLADGVTVLQFSVLNHLIRVEDGRTPLQIASAFQVPKTSMTHTLAGLEERGLIEFKPNLEDGRSKRVWLTKAGKVFREQAVSSLADDFHRIRPQINVQEVLSTIPVLQAVRQVLDKDRD